MVGNGNNIGARRARNQNSSQPGSMGMMPPPFCLLAPGAGALTLQLWRLGVQGGQGGGSSPLREPPLLPSAAAAAAAPVPAT